jgi:hypothetical protein
MWFSTGWFLRVKLRLLSHEQLADLRRDMTEALILTTEEADRRCQAALERADGYSDIARARLTERADHLQDVLSFLWADFHWPAVRSLSQIKDVQASRSTKLAS